MFGLPGPNGAGKSTFMRILATMQEPDAGTIFLNGMDTLRGKIYSKRILKNEIDSYKDNYQVLSEKLLAGQPFIHIYSDEYLQEGFHFEEPTFEDVFFLFKARILAISSFIFYNTQVLNSFDTEKSLS